MVKRKQADDDNTSAEPFAKGLKTDGGRLGLSAAAASGGSNGNNPSQLSHSATATKGVSFCDVLLFTYEPYIITCLTFFLNSLNISVQHVKNNIA